MKNLRLSEAEADAHIERLLAAQEFLVPRNRCDLAQRAKDRGLALASHDDETAEHVTEAAELGITVTEFPTTLAAARAARDNGMKIIMGAPNLMRGGSHSGNVSAAELAAEGLLDNLASDYVPGSLLQAAFRLAEEAHGLSLPQAVATVSASPAATAGLSDRGRIAPGLKADLLRVAVVEGRPFMKTVWRDADRVM
jgi:alpha-D-ribose 1-methylphosphonate 5-triphosphate diphosphatase